MSTILKDEIYKFVATLPEWQKILASYLLQITSRELQKVEAIQLSYEALLFENKLGPAPTQSISSIAPGQLENSDSSIGSKYRFVAVSEVRNLNAFVSSSTTSSCGSWLNCRLRGKWRWQVRIRTTFQQRILFSWRQFSNWKCFWSNKRSAMLSSF
ncbi:MAG: hypothetical protein IPK04_14300 [Bdellovibrionales bacterium]|nr:hypothetical protein [Bdellovibrionales bacterium]